MFQVDFVGHQQYRHPLRPLHPGDELFHGFYVLKCLMVGQAINDDETLTVFYVQVAHASKLFRASGVEYLEHARRTVDFDLFPVKVLYGRVVLLHEPSGHELHGQGALAHAARTQHDHFEFPHRPRADQPQGMRIRIAMTDRRRNLFS